MRRVLGDLAGTDEFDPCDFRPLRLRTVIARALAVAISATASLPPLYAQTRDQTSQHTPANPSEIDAAPSTLKGAFTDSLRLLLVEHTTRVVFQGKTRRELGGNFLVDYKRSLRVPDTWNDGDSGAVNYVGHPVHGAAAGFIWLDHEDGSHDPRLGFSKQYWASRGHATAWAAVYSLQFEFGPLSEASIGNVGLRPQTTGWVDHVVTPEGALAFMVAEDVIDRYLIVRIESWTGNRMARAIARTVLNPSRALSNGAQGRAPWSRAARTLEQ